LQSSKHLILVRVGIVKESLETGRVEFFYLSSLEGNNLCHVAKLFEISSEEVLIQHKKIGKYGRVILKQEGKRAVVEKD